MKELELFSLKIENNKSNMDKVEQNETINRDELIMQQQREIEKEVHLKFHSPKHSSLNNTHHRSGYLLFYFYFALTYMSFHR